jgi:hypothetical protein
LRYLDPELFEPCAGWDIDKLLEYYECAICSGIVLQAVECSNANCSTLYCQACVDNMHDKACPKRCGGQSYNPPNKFVMRQLNALTFKCQQADCPVVSTYEKYN